MLILVWVLNPLPKVRAKTVCCPRALPLKLIKLVVPLGLRPRAPNNDDGLVFGPTLGPFKRPGENGLVGDATVGAWLNVKESSRP